MLVTNYSMAMKCWTYAEMSQYKGVQRQFLISTHPKHLRKP